MENDVPGWITRHLIGTNKVEVLGVRYRYFILSRELEPKLPGFVGYAGKKFLIISEDVPPAYRQWVLTHEILEFAVLPREDGVCLRALEAELRLVPASLQPEYTHYRRDFFERLSVFLRDSPDEFLKAEVARSLEYLRHG